MHGPVVDQRKRVDLLAVLLCMCALGRQCATSINNTAVKPYGEKNASRPWIALAKECASMKVLNKFGPHCDYIAANQRKSTRSKDGRREEKEACKVLTHVKTETA